MSQGVIERFIRRLNKLAKFGLSEQAKFVLYGYPENLSHREKIDLSEAIYDNLKMNSSQRELMHMLLLKIHNKNDSYLDFEVWLFDEESNETN